MTRLVVLLLLTSFACAQSKPAIPEDPTAVILEAFRSHSLVALAEGQHWNQQSHAYRLKLIRDPRLAAVVNDIVVEFGDSRYQEVIDRFVRGEDVSYGELRHVWEDTTMSNTVFDIPVYEEFYRAVREVNRGLPPNRRLRVLLGDPPIDWTKATSNNILDLMYQRNRFAAQLIRKEVLAKNHRALLLYADGHLFRKGEETVPDWMIVKTKPEEPLVSQLEKTNPGVVFVIGAPTMADLSKFEPDVTSWRAPSMAVLRGTMLGAARFAQVYGLTGLEFKSVRMEEQFDAVLYLGPPGSLTQAQLSMARCSDQAYMKMRLSRMAMVPWGQYEIDALKGFCGEGKR